MKYAIIFLAALFIVLAVLMLFAYRSTRHGGLFVMGVAYGAAGGLALILMHWWPLAAGLALVWALKLAGLNPDAEFFGPKKSEEGAKKEE